MLWYYVSDRQERLAVPEDQMSALAGTGILRPTTLVWTRGMAEWVSAGELKPELFLNTAAVYRPGVPEADAGLVGDLARTLRTYAGWVEVSGWLHGLAAVSCVAAGTVVGYFAWRRPERLEAWTADLAPAFQALGRQPWWTVGGLAALALVLFFMSGQLIGGASRARRAEHLRSREELRIALRSMGSFFRVTVVSLLLGFLLLVSAGLYHYRPWHKPEPPKPQAPPAAPAPARERVTI